MAAWLEARSHYLKVRNTNFHTVERDNFVDELVGYTLELVKHHSARRQGRWLQTVTRYIYLNFKHYVVHNQGLSP